MDDESIDIVITSPPYNVGIGYDLWNDNMEISDYFSFIEEMFREIYRVLKKDGRFVLNVLYECKMNENIRMFNASEFWNVMKRIGFKWSGLIDLHEDSPQQVKLTAWGSWMNASAPYVNNPKECLIISYKESWKKIEKKDSYFTLNKSEKDKKDFIKLASGIWDYKPQTKQHTISNFSLDIPINAIKMFCQEGDIVLDCFMGSGSTAIASKMLRNKINTYFIGFELSEKYCKIANNRISKTIPINNNTFY